MERINKNNVKQIYNGLFNPNTESKIIVFSGRAGDGKTTLSRELAIGMALEQSKIADVLKSEYNYKFKSKKKGVLHIDADLRKATLRSLVSRVISPEAKSASLFDYAAEKKPFKDLIIHTNVDRYKIIGGEQSFRFESYLDNHPEFVENMVGDISRLVKSKEYNPIIIDVAGSNNTKEIIPFINMADYKFLVTQDEIVSLGVGRKIILHELLYSINKKIKDKVTNGLSNDDVKKKLTEIIESNRDNLDDLYNSLNKNISKGKVKGEVLGLYKNAINNMAYGLIFSKVSSMGKFLHCQNVFRDAVHNLTSIDGTEEGLKIHNLNGHGLVFDEEIVEKSTNLGASLILAKYDPRLHNCHNEEAMTKFFKETKKSDAVNQYDGMAKFIAYNLLTKTHDEFNDGPEEWRGIEGIIGRDKIENNMLESYDNGEENGK
ncbi:MAG: hypothetical protein KKE23_00190 [Nanoarchaeota archaeon]|nr:hypothetical protein [Nanoarchaeota archaeon]